MSVDRNEKVYLGDGLYASHDGYQFWLRSENGIRVLNEVALEPQVLSSFIRFIEKATNSTIKVTPNSMAVEDDQEGSLND